jgi:hypothetical protein
LNWPVAACASVVPSFGISGTDQNTVPASFHMSSTQPGLAMSSQVSPAR